MSLEMVDRLKKECGLETGVSIDGTHYLKNENMRTSLIEPHKETDFLYCLRADFPETFDRWGVCLFEELFKPESFGEALGKLKSFALNKDEIVKDALAAD